MTQTSMALALAGLSFMLTVIWGTPLLRVLRHFKIGKAIRVDGPERHFSKLGTPTMGGVLIVLPVVLITVAAECHHSDRYDGAGALGYAAYGRTGALRDAGRGG